MRLSVPGYRLAEAESHDQTGAGHSSRTDDLVRVFVDIDLEVLQDTTISRLLYFQLASETYNYNAKFAKFFVGGGGSTTATIDRTCSGGTSRSSSKLYDATQPLGTTMNGTAPWWIAMEDNTNGGTNSGLAQRPRIRLHGQRQHTLCVVKVACVQVIRIINQSFAARKYSAPKEQLKFEHSL